MILHDTAPAHLSHVAQASVIDCCFSTLQHPPYSLNLAPSDFYLFRLSKKNLPGRRFVSDSDLKDAFFYFFDDQDKTFFFPGISALQDKWKKCIDIKGGHIEK